MKTHHVQEPEPQPLGTKKTMLVMITVVGCIAILWPKVFYPMIVGPTPPKPTMAPDYRAPKPATGYKRMLDCCDVVLDADERYPNSSAALNVLSAQRNTFRKYYPAILSEETSVRQERPPHLRPDGMHPAMRERGRAIPTAQVPPIPPKIIDGRPGPIPGMRPPMGAGSHHQAAPKGSSMGFIMPLYTIGIVAFFIYTVMKLVCKKQPAPQQQYTPVKAEKVADVQVNGKDETNGGFIKRPDEGRTKLVVKAIQGIIEATDEHIQKHHINVDNNNVEQPQQSNEETNTLNKDTTISDESVPNGHMQNGEAKAGDTEDSNRVEEIKEPELEASKASGAKKDKGHLEPEATIDRNDVDPIYLDTPVAADSKILVADTDTVATNVVDEALNGTQDDPAVVLSGRMTLNLISPSLTELRSRSEERELKDKSSDKGASDDEKELTGNEKRLSMEVSNVVLMEKYLKDAQAAE